MTPSQSLETRPSAVQEGGRGRTARENEALGEDSGYVPCAGWCWGLPDLCQCLLKLQLGIYRLVHDNFILQNNFLLKK